jgi:hypothetical protein
VGDVLIKRQTNRPPQGWVELLAFLPEWGTSPVMNCRAAYYRSEIESNITYCVHTYIVLFTCRHKASLSDLIRRPSLTQLAF